ncbi:pilin [Streptomyces sp. SL13]|uniref:Pilin n=1 Tax=Streptantibioticus silvisoli TaxID=2705255 RepID=A0AA90H415_9ACTN|nr:pilin [Streptantibioticus silvisoli]MDI5973713.1 pilin [Streptantibioticus silvisoli]
MPERSRRPGRLPSGLTRRWPVRLAVTTAFTVLVTLADPPLVWAVADIPTVVTNLRNWIVGMLAALATLFLTFGGLRYLMAAGDPGEVEGAKRALKAAMIGYALAVLAPMIVTVLQGIVGVGGSAK